MPDVIFTVPFAMEATARFVRAAARREGLRLGIVSQEPLERLPEEIRDNVAGYQQVGSALDPDQLTVAVRALAHGWGGNVDALVGILEPLQESLATTRERLGIPGMGAEAALNFRDKARMKDLLRSSDLPCAQHRLCTTVDEAVDFAATCGYPIVVKPPAGAGARNTYRAEDETQLRGGLGSMPPSAERPVLLEEFMTGQEYSFDSVTINGQHVFHSISCYHPSPLEVMETPWIQWGVLLPRSIDGPEFAAISEFGPKALAKLGMDTGMTHMEWFRRPDDSIAISEVAARPPGAQFTSLISYAHDLDFYDAWIRLVTEGEFEPPERQYSVGAAFLRGQGTGRVVDVHGLEQAQRELSDLVVEAKLPQRGQAQASGYEGEGYVILRHPDTAVVEQGLQRVVSLLRVELG